MDRHQSTKFLDYLVMTLYYDECDLMLVEIDQLKLYFKSMQLKVGFSFFWIANPIWYSWVHYPKEIAMIFIPPRRHRPQ